MVVIRLKLPLEQAEYTALFKVAGCELRNATDQARFILRAELTRRGLLAIETNIDSRSSSISLNDDSKQEGSHVTG